MKRLLIAAFLPLAACGTTLGNQLGLTTAGSAQVHITHVPGAVCPDAFAAGSIPLSGFDAHCKDGNHEESISVQSSDPTALVTQNNQILAGVIGTLIGVGKAATGTGLPNGSAVAMPGPGI